MSHLIETRELAVGYKGKPVAQEINLVLEQGMLTAIIGRNGAGKSTLLKTLTGNIPALRGSVLINGKEIRNYGTKELSRLISVVSTESNMSGGLKLQELVSLGRIPYTGRIGLLGREDKRIVEEAIATVGLSHKVDTFVSNLSDGERQKGMIARGLAQETPLLIMDEPFNFLDVASRLELLELLKQMAEEKGKTILISTHEVSDTIKTADRLWLFVRTEGKERIVDGTKEQLVKERVFDHLFPDSKVKFDHTTHNFILR